MFEKVLVVFAVLSLGGKFIPLPEAGFFFIVSMCLLALIYFLFGYFLFKEKQRFLIFSLSLIIGGGIIGCALARALAGEGVGVAVVERGAPGEEASWAAGGMLAFFRDPERETDRLPDVLYAAMWQRIRVRERGLEQVGALLQSYRVVHVREMAGKLGKSEADAEQLMALAIADGHAHGRLDANTGWFIADGAPAELVRERTAGS